MAYGIEEVFDLTEEERWALHGARIRSAGELLHACPDTEAIARLSERTGIAIPRLGEWAALADLMRLSGVGRSFAELLLAGGVSSVGDLRQREPSELASQLRETNRTHRFSRTCPGPTLIETWIREARGARLFRGEGPR